MRYLSIWIGGIVIFLLAAGLLFWFAFKPTTPANTDLSEETPILGSSSNQPTGSTNSPISETNGQVPITEGVTSTGQKIFKITSGPVAGAAFIQTKNPTTTLARFILQENGHVQDQAIDVAGTLPRAVSNTTIPGIVKTVWTKNGKVAYAQYLDGTVIKTVAFTFPATTTRVTAQGVQIKFLPDGIISIASSPDGTQVAYLLKGSAGSDGYITKPDGSGGKKLFTIPLSEVSISWPAPTTLLLQTHSDASSPGMLFSVNTSTGNVIPLLYANGLTAIADSSFSNIIYQAALPEKNSRYSYIHNIKQGGAAPLSFDPIPEKCAWSQVSSSVIYCAAPTRFVDSTYLDLWHKGTASVADALLSFDVSTARSNVIGTPGSIGGVASDIAEIAVSADDKYLLFIKKGDRSLWGVRL